MVSLEVLVVVTALQWTVNANALAFAASITTAAALGDRSGRRRLFAIGLALFAVTSAACALGDRDQPAVDELGSRAWASGDLKAAYAEG
jgi:MFS family permease